MCMKTVLAWLINLWPPPKRILRRTLRHSHDTSLNAIPFPFPSSRVNHPVQLRSRRALNPILPNQKQLVKYIILSMIYYYNPRRLDGFEFHSPCKLRWIQLHAISHRTLFDFNNFVHLCRSAPVGQGRICLERIVVPL